MMETTINTNFGECRCCLTKGNHKDMTKEYYFNGSSEIYADVFVECFNLFLCSDTRLTTLICRACVKQLKDAYSFKKTVISLENQMLKVLSNHSGHETVYVNDNIKVESKDAVKVEFTIESNDEDHSDFLFDEEDIIEDPNEVNGEKELLARFPHDTTLQLPTRSSLHTLYPEYAKQLEKLKGQIITAKMLTHLLREPDTKSKTHRKLSQNRNYSKHLELRRNNSTLGNTETIYKMPLSEKMAHAANISTLLENSNLTAFMTKFKNGYPCFYCKRIFEDFEVLRTHQVEHSKDNLKKLILKKYRKGRPDSLVVYVDVKNLKCVICGENIPSLGELKSHLTKQHKKILHSDFTDRVIPFRISDTYMCQVCSFNFETFGAIERHMNTHYRNYVCEECGAGFIAKHRLKIHTYNIHSTVKGRFPCEICKKTFLTHRKFKIHNDLVHKMSKKLQCPKCPSRFSYYYVRQKHLLDAHGETPVIYKCNVCEKEFKRRYPLSIHIKKEHLSQGDFNCELCSYMCYSNNELKIHLAKQHGEKAMAAPKITEPDGIEVM